MEIALTIILAVITGGVGAKLLDGIFNRKQVASNTELTDVQQAQTVVKMANDLMAEKEAWYQHQLDWLKSRVTVLEQQLSAALGEIDVMKRGT